MNNIEKYVGCFKGAVKLVSLSSILGLALVTSTAQAADVATTPVKPMQLAYWHHHHDGWGHHHHGGWGHHYGWGHHHGGWGHHHGGWGHHNHW